MEKIDRLGWAAGVATIAYGHRIGIRVSDPEALERVVECLPPGWKPAARPEVHCMYSLKVGGRKGRLKRFNVLYRGTQRLVRSHDLDSVLETLTEDLKLHVAMASSTRIFVHAGVVGWRGGAIVLPGRSHAGKSTLVAALLRAGATYYSDEYAVLDARGRVHPYPRPLILRQRPDDEGEAPSIAVDDLRVGRRPLPVKLVLFTHFQREARWRPQRLSPGQAALALMENTVPIRYRPEASIDALRRVVARAPAFKGMRGEAGPAVEKILELLREVEEDATARHTA